MDKTMVSVPVEPTDAMIEAAQAVDNEMFAHGAMHGADAGQIYRAMLSAAPAPQPVQGEAVAWRVRPHDTDISAARVINDARLAESMAAHRWLVEPLTELPTPAEPQPQGVEAVAWQRRVRGNSGVWMDWQEYHDLYGEGRPVKVGRFDCEYRPLYDHPPAAQIAAPGNVEPLPRATVKLVVSLLRHRRDSLSNDAAAWLERFAALRSQEPAYGPDGSMSIHYQQDGCQMYKHPPECWSQGQAVAVGDAMVERACRAYFPGWETFHPEAWKAPRRLGMRAAITAALAQQANKEQPPNG